MSALSVAPEVRVVKSLLGPSASIFIRMKTLVANEELSNSFFDILATGFGGIDEQPVLKLRERLIANKASKVKMRNVDIILMTARTWNKYINNQQINRMYLGKSNKVVKFEKRAS